MSHLRSVRLNLDAKLIKGYFRHCTCNTTSNGNAGRRTTSTTMIADAIFLLICEICMRGTIDASHVLVILRMLV